MLTIRLKIYFKPNNAEKMDTQIETKKIMRKAIQSYAEQLNEEVTNTQIKIYTDCEKATPKYKILNSFKDENSLEITIKQLMLVPKVDFTGKGLKAEMFVEPTIKNILIAGGFWGPTIQQNLKCLT